MSNKVIVKVGSLRGKLINCPKKVEYQINKACSYYAENYQFADAYIDGKWDGKIKKYSLSYHTFPSGLMYRICQILKNNKLLYEIQDSRKTFEWTEARVIKNLKHFKFQLRPYQVDGLIRGLNVPYMVYWWATSAGKTVQFAATITALKMDRFRRTLIVVSTKDLARQHREELGSMLRMKIGLIEEGRFEPEDVTVAVINTLWNKSVQNKNRTVINYLNKIEHLILDEAHHTIDSKMFKQTVRKCSGTIARHGFSGTPFNLSTSDLELESVTGPPLSRVTMSFLIKEGFVSRPEITMFKYDSPNLSKGLMYASAYAKGIVDSEIRNEIVSAVALHEYNHIDEPTILIIIRIIRHGKILKDLLEDAGIYPDDIRFIHGSTPDETRMMVKNEFKNKDVRVVIASSIWVEGIDIPTVGVLISADGGGGKEITDTKGIRSVIQKTGRVIRKPILPGEIDVRTDIENIVRIYDMVDSCEKNLLRHSINRFLTFKMEPEFRVEEVKYASWKSKNAT
jgi:superfamily II DNA or RNA helicase